MLLLEQTTVFLRQETQNLKKIIFDYDVIMTSQTPL